jgi:hypothetical protein
MPLLKSSDEPTAVQATLDAQESACNRLRYWPVGFAVVSMVHAVPSQCSASVEFVPAVLVAEPTAVQEVELGHDTPERLLLAAPVGFAVVSMVHAVPSQCSASVEFVPAASVYEPTAVHKVGSEHDTAAS